MLKFCKYVLQAICLGTIALKVYPFSQYSRLLSFHRSRLTVNMISQSRLPKSPLSEIIAQDIQLSNDITELPDSFDDSVARASDRILACFSQGVMRCRLDFDTSVGDQTYTSIKNSMPMLKPLLKRLCIGLDFSFPSDESTSQNETAVTIKANEMTEDVKVDKLFQVDFTAERSLRIFFPDMGMAALARRDWKMGTIMAEVPLCVTTANIQNDPLLETDKLAVILCPQYSETDSVKRVMDICAERGVPCLMINPELINMDQGFGVRARNIRNAVLGTFTVAYKLKTLPKGALVREWPKGYSLWIEDAKSSDGYSLLKCFATEPPRETVNELFDEMEAKSDPNYKKPEDNFATNVAKGVLGFFQGLSKL